MYGDSERKRTGPIYEAYRLFVAYDLRDYITNVLERGVTVPLKTFRKHALSIVREREHDEWRATLLLYKSLDVFQECIKTRDLCVWWKVSLYRPELTRKIYVVIRLLSGQQALSRKMHDQKTIRNDLMHDQKHILFRCSKLGQLREITWGLVLQSMPIPMAEHVKRLNDAAKVTFLLSGFRVNFTPEWSDVYASVANFIFIMYSD